MEKFVKTKEGYVQLKHVIRFYIYSDTVYAELYGNHSDESEKIESYKTSEYAHCALDMFMEHLATHPDDPLLMMHSQLSLERMEKQGLIDSI